MLITLSCRAAICQSAAEVYLTDVATMGAERHRLFLEIMSRKDVYGMLAKR
jgi:hypothetical protein